MTDWRRKVVVTGMGIVSPIGIGKDAFWMNSLAGKSGFGFIQNIDASSFPCRIAAEVRDFQPEDFLSRRQVKFLSRGSQFACASFKMAQDDAGLEYVDPHRTDVIIGCATSSFPVIEEQLDRSVTGLKTYKAGEVDPAGMIKSFIFAPAAAVALMAQACGYVTTVSSACASGLNAVGLAAERIGAGLADISIAGGTDTPINRFVLSGMCAAGMLNTSTDDPAHSVRPFDLRRTKQALGEGSVVLILEEKGHALERGAIPYAEIESFAHSTENMNELFLLQANGERWAAVLKQAVGKRTKGLRHISAHAPGDSHIDRAESVALHRLMGADLANITVSSAKGAVGQGLASAGAFQLAASLLALKNDELPPSANFEQEDPQIDLRVLRKSQSRKGNRILVSGHAVGGINTALLLKEFAI